VKLINTLPDIDRIHHAAATQEVRY